MTQQPIQWETTLDSAQRLAGQTNRLVLIHFCAPWCNVCKRMETDVLGQPSVTAELRADYVAVKINADQFPATAQALWRDGPAYYGHRIAARPATRQQEGNETPTSTCPTRPSRRRGQAAPGVALCPDSGKLSPAYDKPAAIKQLSVCGKPAVSLQLSVRAGIHTTAEPTAAIRRGRLADDSAGEPIAAAGQCARLWTSAGLCTNANLWADARLWTDARSNRHAAIGCTSVRSGCCCTGIRRRVGVNAGCLVHAQL